MTKLWRRMTAFLCVALVLFMVWFTAANSGFTVYAAGNEESYEKTAIEDDLKDIDVLEYPANPFGSAKLISFMEYCYSERSFLAEAYGLFFYVYNPTEKELRTERLANVVMMATEYNADGDPTDYDNLPLTFLDCTDNHRFYKFKLENSVDMLAQAKSYAKAHNGERRYDVVGIQLWEVGADTAEDHAVSVTYRWTGFAKGCGEYSNADSTLECVADDLLTLDIPLYHTNAEGQRIVNQTYYRTDKSSLGANHQWQIDTVYFSVDKAIGDKYGILQKIKAKWYEYQTQPIYVTSSNDLKSAFTPYIGVDLSTMTTQEVFNIGYGFGDFAKYIGGLNGDDDCFYWNWAYAMFEAPYRVSQGFTYNGYTNRVTTHVNQIDWLFKVENAGNNTITSTELWNYARDYSSKHGVSKTDEYLKLLGLSDKLFTSGTAVHGDGKEVKRGENILEFDTDATFDLRSYDSTLSGWDRFHNWWYGIKNGSSWEINDFRPIEEITADRLSSLQGADEIANDLKINKSDAEEFRTWAKAEIEGGKQVYLFRFAVTDYTQQVLSVQRHGNRGGSVSTTSHPISMAQEAVFFGFEMLTVTYNNHGVLTVIPVVQSPIHVFDNIDIYLQEPEGLTWWQILLAIILILLLVLILLKFCPWLIQIIVWIILLPFKVIAAFFKSISKSAKRRREKKALEQPKEIEKPKETRAEKKARKRQERQERKARNAVPDYNDWMDEIDWDDPFWSDLDDFNG